MIGFTSGDIAVNLLIFVLSTFLGIELIRHVSRLLHTPLMALTNAISSVAIVAALIVVAEPRQSPLDVGLAAAAVALAVTNIVSGFMITDRILRMFKKEAR
ncbi:MAG TPA: NAD(P) transhydrogenase subunit alpha [Elusimicrobiota bacterium]|jgi:NAD(P) transhydrogenase subunit alpha|nr:NAD(P) transhydrogenase subunit alpha [Elusimicrobiota bacterium]